MKKINIINAFWLLLLTPNFVFAQVPNDGIPDVVPGSFSRTNVTYFDPSSWTIKSEVFNSPDLTRDTGVVGFLNESVINSTRSLDQIPTFALAKFHWWLFSNVLHRAQRQYADCIAGIRENQLLLGESLIDGEMSPDRAVIDSVRDYEIPFEAIQRPEPGDKIYPPTKDDAIMHARAAIASVNGTVANRMLCEYVREAWRMRTAEKLKSLYSETQRLSATVLALKKRCGSRCR